eukprot:5347637-Amphidinium_carterae.1
MLSGRYIYMISYASANAEQMVRQCCMRLGISRSGAETLLHGIDVVPSTAIVQNWPGIRLGEVCEYQLVVEAQQSS